MTDYTPETPLKRCTLCGIEKPLTKEFFSPRKEGRLKFNSWCRECVKAKKRLRRKTPLPEILPEGQKRCPKCKVIYPATGEFFSPNKRGKYKLASWCKPCNRGVYHQRAQDDPQFKQRLSQHARERYRTDTEHRESLKAYSRMRMRQYRQNNPAFRERNRLRSKQWKTIGDNRERRLRLDRERWQESGRDKQREKYQNDPEYRMRILTNQHNREARKRSLPNTLTVKHTEKMMEYWGGRCAVCGRMEDFWTRIALDHWIPLNSPDCTGTIPINIIPLCHGKKGVPAGEPTCNASKLDRNPHSWLIEKLGKRKSSIIEKRIADYFEWIENQ